VKINVQKRALSPPARRALVKKAKERSFSARTLIMLYWMLAAGAFERARAFGLFVGLRFLQSHFANRTF
jgi:hypothetical protein